MIELKKFSVLIVEDDAEIRNVFKNILNLLFDNVYIASNGLEAIDILESNLNIDIVITDINMPKMNGYDLIKIIKEKYTSLPVIVTTAHANIDLIIRIKELDVQDYLIKPVDILELTNKSKYLLVE